MSRLAILLSRWLMPLLALLAATSLSAEDARWYQVEVILFSHDSETFRDSEYWPRDYRRPNTSRSVILGPGSQDPDSGQAIAFGRLEASALQLTAEAGRIRADGGMTLLEHFGWVQPGLAAEQAMGVQVRIEQPSVNDAALSAPQLEGVLTVTLSRFLHMNADLLYREPMPGFIPTTASRQQAIEDLFQFNGDSTYMADGTAWQVYRMEESRRMRSNELHYLDHPRFGMLVLITPLQ